MPDAGILGAVGAVGSLFGSSSEARAAERASDAQVQAQREAIEAQRQATQEARELAIPLFGAQQQNRLAGFQGALDLFGQTIPGQMQAFQQGNIGAQQTLSGSLDPQIQAILGGNIDVSGIRPRNVAMPSADMFNVQLPEFTTIEQALAGVNPALLGGQQQPPQQGANIVGNPGGFFQNMIGRNQGIGTGGFGLDLPFQLNNTGRQF